MTMHGPADARGPARASDTSSNKDSSTITAAPDRHHVGLTILLALLLSAFCFCEFFMLPMAAALLLVPGTTSRQLLRRWEGLVAKTWLSFGGWLLEKVGGVKLILTGDSILPGDRVLILSNHRTRIDWMFLWCWAARFDLLSSYRVILKSSLRTFPWWGWGMSLCLFPFIHRGSKHRDADLARIEHICRYLSQLGVPNSLILFPEGTDLSPSNQKRDRDYALAKNLPIYHNVLHPRSGAFIASLTAMRPHLDAVVDLTIGYVDYTPGERPSELSLLKGRLPREIHINIRRWDIKTTPLLRENQAEGAEQFLRESFDRKEALLTAFYGDNNKDTPAAGLKQASSLLFSSSSSPFPNSSAPLACPSSSSSSLSFSSSSNKPAYARNARWTYGKGLLATGTAMTLVLVLACYLPAVVFWGYCIGVFLLFVIVNSVWEGFDTLELNLAVWWGLQAEQRKQE